MPGPQTLTNPTSKTTNCSHGLGIGVQGASLRRQVLQREALQQVKEVGSVRELIGTFGRRIWIGSTGGKFGKLNRGYPAQSMQAPWVFGAYAGYGPGIFITNADSPSQLGGPFAVLTNVDIGVGIGKASIQVAADKSGTFIVTINGGPAPIADGLGGDVSGFTSNTKTFGTGCKQ
jgi:hypothetical protein